MPWAAIAAPIVGAAVSAFMSGKSRTAKYTPNPTWVAMQEDIMKSIQTGVAAGGYTWDDATNESLKRSAVESAATPFRGAQERVMGGLAPYGNIGALGRSLSGMNTERALSETSALRGIDTARATQKLGSYNQLLGLGAGINDPNLPQMQTALANAQNPSTAQMLGAGLSTGVGTGINLYQAQQSNDFWNKYLAAQSGSGMGLLNSRSTGGGGYNLNANLGMFK